MRPALFDFDRRGYVTFRDADIFLQAFQHPHPAVVAQYDRARREYRIEGFHQHVETAFHSSGIDLHAQHIAKTIDDQSRQIVGLGMNRAVEWPIVKRFSQRERRPQSRLEEWASISTSGSDDSIRPAIKLCGLKNAVPSLRPSAATTVTRLPGGSDLAAASIATSLEKIQGCPETSLLWRPGRRLKVGRGSIIGPI